jgi:hypothetical protein
VSENQGTLTMPQRPAKPLLTEQILDAWLDAGEAEEARLKAIRPYLDAAAVLSSFDPDHIWPVGGIKGDAQAVSGVLEVSRPLGEPGPRVLWQLDESQRRIALERMGTRAALRKARAANPGAAADPVQRGIDLLLEAHAPPKLDGIPFADLLGLERASRWLERVSNIHLPDPHELTRRIERERVLQPMRRLLANGFVGREAELTTLRGYVGVLSSERPSIDLRKTPLFLHGPGGIGKSTLLAKFILEHADPSAQQPLPFVYLDFDRATLNPQVPDTLLAEAIRQIDAQFPELLLEAKMDAQARERFSSEEGVESAKSDHFVRSGGCWKAFPSC